MWLYVRRTFYSLAPHVKLNVKYSVCDADASFPTVFNLLPLKLGSSGISWKTSLCYVLRKPWWNCCTKGLKCCIFWYMLYFIKCSLYSNCWLNIQQGTYTTTTTEAMQVYKMWQIYTSMLIVIGIQYENKSQQHDIVEWVWWSQFTLSFPTLGFWINLNDSGSEDSGTESGFNCWAVLMRRGRVENLKWLCYMSILHVVACFCI